MTGMSRRKVIALILATLLPVASIALMLWSYHDRADAATNVKAAVVNLDEMATIGEGEDAQPFPGGRLLTAGLTTNEDVLTWDIVSQSTARDGLESGDYAAIITIPKEFSASVVGVLNNSPTQAPITVETNEANSQLVSFLSRYIAQTAAATTGYEITEMFINSTLTQVQPLAGGLTDAADGANQLAQGTNELSDGLGQISGGAGVLADGVTEAGTGASQLADGARQLNTGIGQFAQGVSSAQSGAGQLTTGASQLAGGVSELATGTRELAGGASELATGAEELAGGLSTLSKEASALPQGVRQLNSGAEQLADGLTQASQGAQALRPAVAGLAGGSEELAQGAQAITGLTQSVQLACSDPSTADECAAALGTLTTVVSGFSQGATGFSQGADQLVTGLGDLPDGLSALAAGANDLAEGTSELAAQAPQLTQGITQLSNGATELAGGTQELASGTSQLADGAAQLNGGAGALSQGLGELTGGLSSAAAGASQLQQGSSQLATGTSELATGITGAGDGARELAEGLEQLDDGSTQLAGGADELADGLGDASQQVDALNDIPDTIGSVLAKPIISDHVETNPLGSAISGLAGPIAAVFMWVGAFALSLIHRISPRTYLGTTVPVGQRLASGLVIPGVVTLIQTAALLAVLVSFGVKIANWPLTIVVLLVGTLTFMVITEVFVLLWGKSTGWLVSLLFFAVQAASVGGLLPIDTAPHTFQVLNALVPLPLAADALNASIAGATSAHAGIALLGLVMWLLIAGAAAWWAAAREERWRPLPTGQVSPA